MAYWDLRELIRACGGAGAFGQSFKTDVKGAAEGVKMTDYLIRNPVWGGQPLSPDEYPGGVESFGTYGDNTLLSVTLGLTVGAQAYRIQRTGTDAFYVTFLPIDNGYGHSATVESVTVENSGQYLTADIRLRSAINTSSMLATASAYGPVKTSTVSGLQVQPVQWVAYPYGTPGGTTTFQLYIQYDPDIAGFNPMLDQFNANGTGWKIRLANRVETVNDYDFEWHLNSSFTQRVTTEANPVGFGTVSNAYNYGYGPYLTDPEGSRPYETSEMWLRYKRKTDTSWTPFASNPVSYTATFTFS